MIMAASAAKISAISSKLNDDETIKLLMALVDTPSTTGYESPAAELLADHCRHHGVSVKFYEVEEGRKNVVGTVRGSGGGPSVLFNGHLDTSFTGRYEEDYAMGGDLAEVQKPKAVLKDGVVYGLGARNMKGGVTAMFATLCALAESGVKLQGDVICAGVVGEIERTPVKGLLQSFEGKEYRGCGVGMRFLMEHGVTADYGITTEPTSNRICRGRVGFTYVKLITKGVSAYVPSKSAGLGENAILKMSKVVRAVEEDFGPKYVKEHTYELSGNDGTLIPQVNVGGIQGGLPYKPNYVPAICYSYVSLFFPPILTPNAVVEELREFLDAWGAKNSVKVEAEPYLVRAPATETGHDHFIVKACKRAYETVMKEKHTAADPSKGSVGDDSNTLRVWGIPSVTWGPGGVPTPQLIMKGENNTVKEVADATRMFAAAIVEICDRPRGQED